MNTRRSRLRLAILVAASVAALGVAVASAQSFGGQFSQYPIPTAGSQPGDLVSGPDGAVWFTEASASRIGRVTANGQVTEYALGSAVLPRGIAVGPDGALWFLEDAANQVGRITTAGQITTYAIATPSADPYAITAGPDGAMWFTEYGANQIARITTSGTITEFPIPTPNSAPDGITAGPDGALWFTEFHGPKIGRIPVTATHASPQITEYPTPGAGDPAGIAAGIDGALWYVDFSTDVVGRLTPQNGHIDTFAVPTANSEPIAIAQGQDGALWFTEQNGNRIGRIAPSGGYVAEYPLPSGGGTRVLAGAATFTAATTAHATLVRNGLVYADGTSAGAGLTLHAVRTIPAGRYLLELTYRLGAVRIRSTQPVALT